MYKLIKTGDRPDQNPACILNTVAGVYIPFDPDNTDYQAYLKFLAEGGKVYGADEEVPDGQANQ
jgi:hypothetical protein